MPRTGDPSQQSQHSSSQGNDLLSQEVQLGSLEAAYKEGRQPPDDDLSPLKLCVPSPLAGLGSSEFVPPPISSSSSESWQSKALRLEAENLAKDKIIFDLQTRLRASEHALSALRQSKSALLMSAEALDFHGLRSSSSASNANTSRKVPSRKRKAGAQGRIVMGSDPYENNVDPVEQLPFEPAVEAPVKPAPSFAISRRASQLGLQCLGSQEKMASPPIPVLDVSARKPISGRSTRAANKPKKA